jgi:hypothetical protein
MLTVKTLSPFSSFEPFVERIRSQGLDQYCVGYRLPNGEVVSSIVVSASLLGEFLVTASSIDLSLSIDGFVSAHLSELTGGIGAPRSVLAIDDLLRDALRTDNLRLEEASVQQLRALQDRLEASASMVRRVINEIEQLSAEGPPS